MNLVTIIIPYYKKIKYIKNTLNSIFKQTYHNYEIIIVYDDSNLNDLIKIKKITKNKRNIKIIINKNNLGAGMSRNIGIKNSKGKFIAFLDSDDVWHKNKLKKQINFMKKNKTDFSFSDYLIIDKNEKVLKKIKAPKKITFNNLSYACDIGLSSVMIKSKLLKINKFSKLKTKEDYLLWLTLSKKNVKMLGINKTLISWRKTENSLSSSTIQKVKDAFIVYNKYMEFNPLKSIYLVFILSFNAFKKRYL
jgi:teichuronic acid biosynthesis glycosyltransferase TuaG